MKKGIYLLSIIILTTFWTPSSAQTPFPDLKPKFKKLAQSTMTFLNIDVGARPVGMGSAFTCMENDASNLFWNPAGIAKIKGGAVSLNHTQWLVDMKQYAIAAVYGTQNYGTFGASFLVMDNGSFERTIPDDSSPRGFYLDGTFNVNQWATGLAYSRQLTDKFLVGGQVKYVYQDLGDADIVEWSSEAVAFDTVKNAKNQKGTVAFDFGTLYYFGFQDLRIGMSFRNFSRPVKYSFESFNLPITFRVGMAMNVMSLISDMLDHRLQICLEAVHPYDHGERILLGGEYMFKNILMLRAGYRSNTDTGALSAGFGLTPKTFGGINLTIDYAYSSVDVVFDSIHRFSFGFRF